MKHLILCTLLASAVQIAAVDKPLNVVVLYADDWRHDTLGCARNPVVKTPNIDAVTNEGVRFTQNRVTTSICGVSRVTLLTGQWMSRHGNKAFQMFDMSSAVQPPPLRRAEAKRRPPKAN